MEKDERTEGQKFEDTQKDMERRLSELLQRQISQYGWERGSLSLTKMGVLKEEIRKQEKDMSDSKANAIPQVMSILFAAFWVTWYNGLQWWKGNNRLWFLVLSISWVLFRSITYFIAKHKLEKARKEKVVLEVMET